VVAKVKNRRHSVKKAFLRFLSEKLVMVSIRKFRIAQHQFVFYSMYNYLNDSAVVRHICTFLLTYLLMPFRIV